MEVIEKIEKYAVYIGDEFVFKEFKDNGKNSFVYKVFNVIDDNLFYVKSAENEEAIKKITLDEFYKNTLKIGE